MEIDIYFRFLLALIFVLALIGILGWLIRRFGFPGRLPPARNKDRRLRIVEIAAVDGKRRLVLLRRDATEHLILLGTTGDTVIESGIAAPAPMTAGDEAGGDKAAEIEK